MRFRGREKLNVDAKGRVSVPARFRDVLQDALPLKVASQLVVVPWFEPCLRVFPLPLWDAKQEAFDAAFGDDDIFGAEPGESDFRRFVYGSAMDVQIDKNGRINLSADMREHAGIEKDVFWVGLGPVLEIWNPEVFKARINRDKAAEIRAWLKRDRRPDAVETA